MAERDRQVTRIVVVGGGITGLTVAYRLSARSRAARQPLDVLLVERSHGLGGVIRTERRDGFLLEAGPDSFVTDKPWTLRLCHELGLAEALVSANPQHRRSFVVHRGRLVAVPDGFSLLGPAKLLPFAMTSALSLRGKWRALRELAAATRTDAADESVAAFVRRRFGDEVFERLAEPMVRGIASDDPAQLSMQALLPQFVEMEQRHGSVIAGLRARARSSRTPNGTAGPRYGLFVSFREGMHTLIDRLATLCAPSICQGVGAIGLGKDPVTGQWRIPLSDGHILTADAVCLALPSYQTARLVRDLDESLAQALDGISYASWITIHLAFRRADVGHPLRGFGFVAPAVEGLPISGCTFSHVKFPGRAPEGSVLLRVFMREDEHAHAGRSDDEYAQAAIRVLQPLVGLRAAPLLTVVHRAPRALPQYHVGHLPRIAGIQERLAHYPGLVVAGNAYRGHGVTNCIGSAEQAAQALYESTTRGVCLHA